MRVLSVAVSTVVAFLVGIAPAKAQDSLERNRQALEIITQAADKICYTVQVRGTKSDTTLSGDVKAELNGLIAKIANLQGDVGAKHTSQEYQGVLQEQLPAVLASSQDCKRAIFDKLSSVLLVQSSPPSGYSISRIEADVAFNCGKLQAWPNTMPGEEVASRLTEISKALETQNQLSNARSSTLAMLYRCMGAAYLISPGELPDKLRLALPYLERSLTLEPQQNLLRENVAFLDKFLKAGGGDIKIFLTTLLQVLRGSDDPDIPDLVRTLTAAAQKNR